MSKAIMCHLVAGYPDRQGCLELLLGLGSSGVTALEVQIPFSDPIADGETIMRANDVALEGHMTTARSFELIETARRQGVDIDIYVMSYVQKVRHFGLPQFCQRATECGVRGLIVPDLPYDSPEFSELHRLAAKHSLELVPVLSPGMPDKRLRAVLALQPSTLYVTSKRGITGNIYAPDRELKQFVAAIKKRSSAKIMIGFGITTPQDVREVLELADVAVVGSAVISKLESSSITETVAYIAALAKG